MKEKLHWLLQNLVLVLAKCTMLHREHPKRMKKWFLGQSKARVKENLIWRELVLAKMAYKSKFAKITSLKVNE